MNFSNLKEWTTPRGNVTELAIDGVTVWKSGVRIGDLAVGSSVFMNVSGSRTEFLVVHQGLPDATLYDASCDGTWLMTKDIYELTVWSQPTSYASYCSNRYTTSTVRNRCSAFVTLLESNIQNIVKEVKIPYTNGEGSSGVLGTLTNGYSCRAFLLSLAEVGSTQSGSNIEGATLDYFNGLTNSERIAYFEGTAVRWWLRSPLTSSRAQVWHIYNSGAFNGYGMCSDEEGIRPALILPSSACIDENFNVIA